MPRAHRPPTLGSRKLRVERLEDRRVLASIVVGNNLDTVNGDVSSITALELAPGFDGISIREAIAAANNTPGADEITFDFGHDGPEVILLTEGELLITDALSITGDGPELLTIDAQQQSRIFNIDPSTLLEEFDSNLAGMKLANGRATGDGGAISSSSKGMLTLNQMAIVENTTDRRGGGVYALADVTVLGSRIANNHSTLVDSQSLGGGVYAYGLVLTNSEIVGNSAQGRGGGISATVVVVNDSTISHNTAALGGGVSAATITAVRTVLSENSSTGSGGGIFASFDATLNWSLVTNNTVGGSIANRGGGIYAAGDLTISNSLVAGNQAHGTAASGGGFWAERNLWVLNSTISNNSAAGGRGSGMVTGFSGTFSNSTITANHAAQYGGGIWARNTRFALINTILAGNSASDEGQDIYGLYQLSAESSIVGSGIVFEQSSVNVVVSDNPRLGPLAEHGGHSLMHALLPESPAIDSGIPAILLDAYSANQFAKLYNFADLASGAFGGAGITDGVGGLNVGSGVGAHLWSRGETLHQVGDEVRIEFGFNYPITQFETEGFASAGMALFDSVDGMNLLADIRVETDETGPTNLQLSDGTSVVAIDGTPTEAFSLVIAVTNVTADALEIQYTLSAEGIIPITQQTTLAATEVFFGPSAGEVMAFEAYVDNLKFWTDPIQELTDQRGEGFPRVADGGNGLRIDIGAYESQGIPGYPTGDYNHDGIASLADYTVWRDALGSTTDLAADGDDSMVVDAGDYTVWKQNFGNTTIPLSAPAPIAASTAASDAAFAMYESPQSLPVTGRGASLVAGGTKSGGANGSDDRLALLLLDGVERSEPADQDLPPKAAPSWGEENQESADADALEAALAIQLA